MSKRPSVVDLHLPELRPELPHGTEAGEQRLDGGGVAGGLERLLGVLDCGRDARKPLCQLTGRARAGEAGQPANRVVDAVEHRLLLPVHLPGDGRLHELEGRGGRAGQRQQLRHALALVHAARFGADLGVGPPEQWIVRRQIDRQKPAGGRRPLGGTGEAADEVVLLRLPRSEPFLDLFGILCRVGGELERLARDDRRRLVVLAAAVPVGPRARGSHRAGSSG